MAANRFWLLAPPDTVTDYSYVFHLQWDKAPGGFILTPVRVTDPRSASANERQGITYSSLLQRLTRHPEQVEVQSVAEADGKITLALKILPVPGAKTTFVAGGKTYPIPPLRIECGNGISQNWRGEFQTGGTNAMLVVDAEKMVPLNSLVQAALGTVEESFSDYAEISPGNYAPLSVSVKWTGLPKSWADVVFDWKFKLHDGLWLFDESHYRGVKVAWIDQVAINHLTAASQPNSAAEQAFGEESKARLGQSRQWALACIMFAENNQNQLPQNFDQLGRYSGNLSSSNWELVSAGQLNRFSRPAQTILLRETKPRQAPDGSYSRVYAFADGHAQLISFPDANFTAAERKLGLLVQPAKP